MPIRASSAKQIDPLIAALSSSHAASREAAVARLTVIGARAVDRLVAEAARRDAGVDARIAALHALEGIGDARAFEVARQAAGDPAEPVALAGVGVLRRLIRTARESDAIAALTATTLTTAHAGARRVAAAEALSGLGHETIAPLAERLRTDTDTVVAAWAAAQGGARGRRQTQAPPPSLEMLLERGLPDDPEMVRRLVSRGAGELPLTVLRRVVEATREREDRANGKKREEWSAARAAAHVALAERGSRLALYDIRESLAAATAPLPVEFLAAVTAVGDASCLEPLAAAYAKSTRSGERWWREHLRHVFHAIVQRDRITTRHAAMKKVMQKWPGIVQPIDPPDTQVSRRGK